MSKLSNTERRIANIMEGMRKAMPEIKRQIEVYENAMKSGSLSKPPKVKTQ